MNTTYAGKTSQPTLLDFQPPTLLRHPHLQSTLSSAGPRRRLVRERAAELIANTTDLLLDCGDDVRLAAHASIHSDAGDHSVRPLVIAIHGWNGSHESSYMLSAATSLFAAGIDVVRLNLRDHGGTAHLNQEMFHSCMLDEAVAATANIMQRYGARPYGLLGFSLGGNFALRIAKSATARGLRLASTLAVCPLLDPAATMQELDSGWLGYRLYFIRKWRSALAEKDAAFPGVFDFSAAKRMRTITDMTVQFVGDYTDFPSTESYLNGYTINAASMAGLQVPCTILAALDDPVCPSAGLVPLAEVPGLTVQTTRWGGHCGFLENLRLDSWADGYIRGHFLPLLDH